MQKIQKIKIGVGLLIVAVMCFISAIQAPSKRIINIAVGSACFILGIGCIKYRNSAETVILKIPRR